MYISVRREGVLLSLLLSLFSQQPQEGGQVTCLETGLDSLSGGELSGAFGIDAQTVESRDLLTDIFSHLNRVGYTVVVCRVGYTVVVCY